jgi:hypothetical protein
MLLWGGIPFYGLCLFFLTMFIVNMIRDADAPALFADLVFFLLFALTSIPYFLLTRLFLTALKSRRTTLNFAMVTFPHYAS